MSHLMVCIQRSCNLNGRTTVLDQTSNMNMNMHFIMLNLILLLSKWTMIHWWTTETAALDPVHAHTASYFTSYFNIPFYRSIFYMFRISIASHATFILFQFISFLCSIYILTAPQHMQTDTCISHTHTASAAHVKCDELASASICWSVSCVRSRSKSTKIHFNNMEIIIRIRMQSQCRCK